MSKVQALKHQDLNFDPYPHKAEEVAQVCNLSTEGKGSETGGSLELFGQPEIVNQ